MGIPVIMVSRPDPPDYPLRCATAAVAAQIALRHWIWRHGRR
jgi:hypothetical protein